MQVHYFNDGTFVAHGVRVQGSASRFSIWGDREGNLTDCERRTSKNHTTSVPKSYKRLRTELAKVSKRIANGVTS